MSNNSDIEDKIKSAYEAVTPDKFSAIQKKLEADANAEAEVIDFSSSKSSIKKHEKNFALFAKYASLAASLALVFFVGLNVGKNNPVKSPTHQQDLPVSESKIDLPTVTTIPTLTPENNLPAVTAVPDVIKIADIYLDVNPSIEMSIDEEHRVIECIPANEDAVVVLSDMKLEGVAVKTALNAIIGSMYMNGYINDESNSVLISVETDKTDSDELLNELTTDVDDIFKGANITCSVISQLVTGDASLKETASSVGVSIGKLKFIDEIIDLDDELSVDDIVDLAELSINELNVLLKSYRNHTGLGGNNHNTHGDSSEHKNNTGNDVSNNDTCISDNITVADLTAGISNLLGTLFGYVSYDTALENILEELSLAPSDINDFTLNTSYGQDENGRRNLIYHVSFSANDKSFNCKVNAKTGKIIKISEEEK